MGYIKGTNRFQVTLLPPVLDDYVEADSLVRFLDEYVDTLPLAEMGFTHTILASTGRSPYDPHVLLKLYLYGYLNRITSSRNLEKETKRNTEVMWLLTNLRPDFKTIADFRKDNRVAIRKVFRNFVVFCKGADLFGCELIGIDGSKFDAVNHSGKQYSRKKLQRMLEQIQEKTTEYLRLLEEGDLQEDQAEREPEVSYKKKLEQLAARKSELEQIAQQLEESGQEQIALTDPDSRLMTASTGRVDMSYNVQIAVDSKHHLIVEYEATNSVNDQNELSAIAIAAKEALGVATLNAMADMGFYTADEIQKCEEAGITCWIPRPSKSNNKRKGLYTNEDFHYDAVADVYRCPAAQILTCRGERMKGKRKEKIYGCPGCGACSQRSKCTTRKRGGRRIYRWEHEHLLEAMQERMKNDPQKMDDRRNMVEHPFGTMKCSMDQRAFRLKGTSKVNCEMGLTALAYNIKRVVNILGVETMRVLLRKTVFAVENGQILLITLQCWLRRSNNRILNVHRSLWSNFPTKASWALAA